MKRVGRNRGTRKFPVRRALQSPMSSRLLRLAAAATLTTLAAAAPAVAAPDRTIALDQSQTTATWQGAAATSLNGTLWWDESDPTGSCGGFGVDAVDHCDQTLVKLTGTGSLDVQLPDAGDGDIQDWDVYVYTANPDGTAGDEIGFSDNAGGAEDVPIDGAAGDYLVIAVPYQAVNSGYGGALKFTPDPTP